jgi:hypothetical protein
MSAYLDREPEDLVEGVAVDDAEARAASPELAGWFGGREGLEAQGLQCLRRLARVH